MNADKTVEIGLTLAERELLAKDTYADMNLLARLRIARLQGKQIRISLSLEDLDILLGDMAFAINHSSDRKVTKKLNKLYDRLRAIEEAAIRRARKARSGASEPA